MYFLNVFVDFYLLFETAPHVRKYLINGLDNQPGLNLSFEFRFLEIRNLIQHRSIRCSFKLIWTFSPLKVIIDRKKEFYSSKIPFIVEFLVCLLCLCPRLYQYFFEFKKRFNYLCQIFGLKSSLVLAL